MTSVHIYLSTHCFHGHHDTCRLTCKFCPARCYCPCHPWNETEPQVTYTVTTALSGVKPL